MQTYLGVLEFRFHWFHITKFKDSNLNKFDLKLYVVGFEQAIFWGFTTKTIKEEEQLRK